MRLDNNLFDNLTEKAKSSPRLRMNFDLRDSLNDGSMRMLNALEPGTVIPIHRHNDTSEEVVCLRGAVEEILYDSNGIETARFRLSPSDGCLACKVPIGQFHTCISLESGSIILEFKNGKYNPQTTEDFLPNPPSPHPASSTDILTISSGSAPSSPTALASACVSEQSVSNPTTCSTRCSSSEPNNIVSSDTSRQPSVSPSDASVRTSSCTSAHTSTRNSAQSVSATDFNQPDSSTFIPAPDPRAFDGGDILRQKKKQ